MKSLILLAIVFAVCLSFSEAIKCYRCDAGDNCKEGECEDKFCFKRAGEIAGKRLVSKGCQSTGGDSCSKTDIGQGSIVGATCTCDSNWCNSGRPSANVAISMLAMAVVAALGVRKLLF